jgi:ferritin-like metal-binding protein YciE
MANYGTLAAWADQLDLKEAADHLRLTLKEESGADEKLSKLALSGINEAAESASAA